MGEIKGIIFDMDGVLIDAKEWHYEALNRALSLFGYSISRYDHLSTYDGLSTRQKLDMLSVEQDLPRGLHPFLNDLKQVYTMELVHSRCKPVFQHEFALSRLKSHGYKLGVASNAVRASVQAMLERANIIHYFDVILSNQDVVRAKPDPEVYVAAIGKLGLQPEECLVVEDNPNGVRSAQAAGARVMVVSSVLEVTLRNVLENVRSWEEEPHVRDGALSR